jgi:pimeloyl-ACP methyl ester carboxylesterase
MNEPWDIDDYCNFVLKVIEKLNIENPVLIGHSHGGRVIMKLVGSGLISPPKIVFLDAAGLIPKKSFKQKLRAKSFKIIKTVLSLPIINKFSASLLEKARNHFGSADYNAAPPVLRKTLVNVVNIDLRHLLPNISCPTLLVWGENDTATPLYMAKNIEKIIPDCGLCVIK